MNPVVTTIETKCKRCYSCIRQCPAKAIRVVNGQAKVIEERCIACGNCIKVCPQDAKQIRDGIEHTRNLILSQQPVIAILAPSFPAAFENIKPGQIISGIRQLGFSEVLEVAFGADLIINDYNKILSSGVMLTVITSPCPAVVNYIEKYYPHLTMMLAPIVSPMIATGRVIKEKYRPDAKVVFIGPCIAKKREMFDKNVQGAIDEVLTFNELDAFFQQQNIELSVLDESDFDGPRADLGRVFPISGGLIECSDYHDDVLNKDVLVSEGRERVVEILEKIGAGDVNAGFVDILFCRGCIRGPMLANDESVFVRRNRIVSYVLAHNSRKRRESATNARKKYKDINFRRSYLFEELRVRQPSEDDIRDILQKTGKYDLKDELNCGACGYATCRENAIAVYQGFAEAEMCLPYMLEKLETIQEKLTVSNKKLRRSLQSLQDTQQQLIQSEKLASVGRLAAGVAHELNNPLGGILLYTGILKKKLENTRDSETLEKVAGEAERCRRIVQGLLDFSRQTRTELKNVCLNQILESTLILVREQSLFQNIKIEKQFEKSVPVFADKLQMQQVFLNILLNAAEAMKGHGLLVLKTGNMPDKKYVFASIRDNGAGMTKDTIERIFDPFYTTKPVGKGTGLGMAIVHGIIQKHGGDIKVQSEHDKGSTFTIVLPSGSKNAEKAHLNGKKT